MTRSGGNKQGVRARFLLLLVCGGVVLGMLGMHSLTQDHALPLGQVVNTHEASLTTTAAIPAETSLGSPEHGGDHRESTALGEHCGVLAICLLAIAAGAALLWLFLSRTGHRPMAYLKRVATVGRVFAQSVVRPPPDLISLSILRC